LTKLFDSMAKLKFRQENEQDTKIALQMSSKDGEEVKLSSPCDCDGQVGLPCTYIAAMLSWSA